MNILETKKVVNLVIDGIANNTTLTREEVEDIVIWTIRSESYWAVSAIEPLLQKLVKNKSEVCVKNLNYLIEQLKECLIVCKTQFATARNAAECNLISSLRKED